jgi:hypothetical protein
MPYPNEHSARMFDPKEFLSKGWGRKTIAPGVDIILAKRTAKGSTVTQAYRFDKTKLTPAQARAWMKAHDLKYILFEVASS